MLAELNTPPCSTLSMARDAKYEFEITFDTTADDDIAVIEQINSAIYIPIYFYRYDKNLNNV